MLITDVFSAASVAARFTEEASNRQEYFGAGLFPARKKMGLDLKWIRAHKGLPISLAPSNFDAKSTLRSREGFKIDSTEMAFFRESMLVKEADEQEIMRVQESNDPYMLDVLNRIYDDADNLVSGANVVPERMRMQLLAPTNSGSPGITLEANGVQYTYNYDPDGSYAANNYTALSGTAVWSDTENSDPLGDLRDAIDAVELASGTRPSRALISKKTMNYLRQNAKVQKAVLSQNLVASIVMTDAKVVEVVQNILGVTLIVYTKKYRNESGAAAQFYPDDYVTLLPDGVLGTTWYGTTPEERTTLGKTDANVSIVNTGVSVSVTTTTDPVNTKITVSEIVLPSYERMDETYVLKVA